MKNSGVLFVEAVVVTDDSKEEFRVMGQVGGCGKQPAIAEIALLDIKARKAARKENRLVAHLAGAAPIDATRRLLREEQALVGRWKFRILKQFT